MHYLLKTSPAANSGVKCVAFLNPAPTYMLRLTTYYSTYLRFRSNPIYSPFPKYPLHCIDVFPLLKLFSCCLMVHTSQFLTYFKTYLCLYLLHKILLHPKSETTFLGATFHCLTFLSLSCHGHLPLTNRTICTYCISLFRTERGLGSCILTSSSSPHCLPLPTCDHLDHHHSFLL